MFYPSIALFGYNDAKEYIKNNFISRTELEEAEIYLNPSCDFFVSKAKELKGTDTDIYEIHFSIGQINSPVKVWIYGDNERLLNELYIASPKISIRHYMKYTLVLRQFMYLKVRFNLITGIWKGAAAIYYVVR